MKWSSWRLKGAHPYRKWACLEALRLATTKLTQRETGYPSWRTSYPTQNLQRKHRTDLQNRIPLKSYHYGPQGRTIEDRRNVGEYSCNSGDGTDQRVQSLMFMMMNYIWQTVQLMMSFFPSLWHHIPVSYPQVALSTTLVIYGNSEGFLTLTRFFRAFSSVVRQMPG